MEVYAILIPIVKSAEKLETLVTGCSCVLGYRTQLVKVHMEARSNSILLMPFPLPGNGLLFFKVSIAMWFSIRFVCLESIQGLERWLSC